MEQKRKKTYTRGYLMPPCTPTPGTTLVAALSAPAFSCRHPGVARIGFLLVFQIGSVQKAQFSSLNP